MNKIIKNIPAFFVLLSGLAICVHMIIPHDHHLAESGFIQEDSCPDSNSKAGHHTGFPGHCHAFNDIAPVKGTKYILTKNINYNIILLSDFADTFKFKSQLYHIISIDFREPFPDSHLLKFSPLRAPPYLS